MEENKKTLISEIFYSIQCEGPNIGKPSIFIRFFGCNLRCKFKGECCDTPYAVLNEHNNAKLYTIEELINEVKKYPNANNIVFTGGEPMLFQDYIEKFIFALDKYKLFYYEVETNGTILLENDFLKSRITQFNLSVKLKSSNQPNEAFDKRRIKEHSIRSYPAYKSIFKFVYSQKEDLEEINNLVKEFNSLEVWLMPEGINREDIINNSEEVIELCKTKGWNFSSRLHLLIWNEKTGV